MDRIIENEIKEFPDWKSVFAVVSWILMFVVTMVDLCERDWDSYVQTRLNEQGRKIDFLLDDEKELGRRIRLDSDWWERWEEKNKQPVRKCSFLCEEK